MSSFRVSRRCRVVDYTHRLFGGGPGLIGLAIGPSDVSPHTITWNCRARTSAGWLSKGGAMTDTTQTEANRDENPGEPKDTRPQLEADDDDLDGTPAQQSRVGSTGRRSSPGRRPLFGT
jgi:hypothetical protein